ncbi:DUF1351 domain-containing protein [Aerococcaceae bacterium NML160702]|nr:DUF1351 domain-containing protein [Aerococcaceae bacterium NML160702]
MNELQVIKPSIKVEIGVIGIENLEAVKQGLTLLAQNYKGIIVTDDDERYKEAKDQRAEINKIIKAVDDERKRIKKLYEAPLKEFEKSVKDVIAIADEAARELDSNIKAVEQLRRDKKIEEVNNLIAEHSEGYSIQMIDRWLNQTYKTSAIIDDIKSQVREIKQEEADKEAKRETIRTACKMAKFDDAGWIAMFEAGADANDVVSRISAEYDRQQKEAEERAKKEKEALEQAQEAQKEQVQQVEVQSFEESTEEVVEPGIAQTFAEAQARKEAEQEEVTMIIRVTTTMEKHNQLGAFCKANGITAELIG